MSISLGFHFIPMPVSIWQDGVDLSKGEFRLLGYILRHTVAFSNETVKLTDDEVLNGRKRRDGSRIDSGCGLATNTMKDARDALIARDMIIFEDGFYAPKIENRQKVLSETDKPLSEIDNAGYNIYIDNNIRHDESVKSDYDTDFEVFWEAFGKVGTKFQAQKSWRAAKKIAKAADLVEAAKAYRADLVRRNSTEYSKHASTWLNNRCWADRLPTHQTTSKEAVKDNPVANKPIWMRICDEALDMAKKAGAREVVQLYFKDVMRWGGYVRSSGCTAAELYIKMCREVQSTEPLPNFLDILNNCKQQEKV